MVLFESNQIKPNIYISNKFYFGPINSTLYLRVKN